MNGKNITSEYSKARKPSGKIQQCCCEHANRVISLFMELETHVIGYTMPRYATGPTIYCSDATVERHEVQPTGCIDIEPEPSRGVP